MVISTDGQNFHQQNRLSHLSCPDVGQNSPWHAAPGVWGTPKSSMRGKLDVCSVGTELEAPPTSRNLRLHPAHYKAKATELLCTNVSLTASQKLKDVNCQLGSWAVLLQVAVCECRYRSRDNNQAL